MSTAHHPQSDGQTERVNQCLETYLRCFVHSCPKTWIKWLALAEFWYNSSFHSTLGKTPFQVVYGQDPWQLGIVPANATPVTELNEWLEERQLMQKNLRQHLHRAKQVMKQQADKKRTFREFSVGDAVFLKLQPYIQTSVANRANHKLSFKYFGPFTVIARVNEVSYRLQLPEGSSIYPVFHVSLLRKVLTPGTSASDQLPPAYSQLQIPERILEKRWRPGARKTREQGLVRWSGADETQDTWEDLQDLQRRFPEAATWGQVASEETGGVSDPNNRLAELDASVHDRGKQVHQPRRTNRVQKPNHKFAGPQWVSYMFSGHTTT